MVSATLTVASGVDARKLPALLVVSCPCRRVVVVHLPVY
jgi:hypothetical protein